MTLKLTTGDPAFNPAEPVTINGYRYVPAPNTCPAELERLTRARCARERQAARYVAPPRPDFAAGYPKGPCNVRAESDEFVCAAKDCGRRWSRDEDKPYCDRDPVWRD